MIPEDALINKLAEQVVLQNTSTDEDITFAALNLMKLIEQHHQFGGERKKFLVLQVINKVTEHVADDVKKFIQNDIPFLIDIFVSLDKKQLRIKGSKIIKTLKKCCISNHAS